MTQVGVIRAPFFTEDRVLLVFFKVAGEAAPCGNERVVLVLALRNVDGLALSEDSATSRTSISYARCADELVPWVSGGYGFGSHGPAGL